MKNQDIYLKNPATRKLVNDGVATVNNEKTDDALRVLRYELETFVCDGQYEAGLLHVLESYLKNLDQAQQSAVWVSGFYGSGKSHLVKMLRALWEDTVFPDGATARGIAVLPQTISDTLRELSSQAKRHGGLHAASGTFGSAASGSVRLALLGIIFKSVGLPERYPIARFTMWLKREGIFEDVKQHVLGNGLDWDEELDNLYVAEGLHAALVDIKPHLFPTSQSCVETLNNLYPSEKNDVSSDEMIKAIRQALTRDGKFPLTLIVVDEVQQFIGEDPARSIAVQEMVEAAVKDIGGKLLFVATGQTAVTGTANLSRLQGRFTLRVELSDADVESVVRKVILSKKPECKAPIDQIMQTNLGEISRQLAGTTIGHRQNDIANFAQDYPILPVRRRFWEAALRVMDQTGTESQLRNQLTMVHKVIQTNLDAPLGAVVPADYLYFDSADRLQQSRVLPRKVHEKTMTWLKGNDDESLIARACGLVFLINKVAGSNAEIGIRATVDSIADLLVEDLSIGSGGLRAKLPELLDRCELLIKVGDEYRIQTEESAAWTDEFLGHRNALSNAPHRIDAERDDRIRKKSSDVVSKLSLLHGSSRISRDVAIVSDAQLPADAMKRIIVWVRDGWSTDENSVRTDSRQAGNNSPTIFVFLPKRSADDLRHFIIEFKAATATLNNRGLSNTPEGLEARAAMETTKQQAEARIMELLNEVFAGVRVFQGGGNEITGDSLADILKTAAGNSLQRLYPNFSIADNAEWSKVYERAQKGAPDALTAIGDAGEPGNNPVCKQILGYIAGGKTGTEVRTNFESCPFGWSRDAVDGGLQVLLVSGLIQARDERGQGVDPKHLERKNIGKTNLKVESTTVSVSQRVQIRKLFQLLDVVVKPGEESSGVPIFLQKVNALADGAGGDTPKPERPKTAKLEDIRLAAGNEQLLALFNQRDELTESITLWRDIERRIEDRFPRWLTLKRLLKHSVDLKDTDVFAAQAKTIEEQRQLLEEPDPVVPIISSLTQMLRDELNIIKAAFDENWIAGEEKLRNDSSFKKLETEQKHDLRLQQQLVEGAKPVIEVETTEAILMSLDSNAISALRDRIEAMPSRFEKVLFEAAKLLEPDVENAQLPSRLLKTETDLQNWLNESEAILREKIKRGPVVV